MRMAGAWAGSVVGIHIALASAWAQTSAPPGVSEPGDEAIHAYLSHEAGRLHARFLQGVTSLEDWQRQRAHLREEYFYMLGLPPAVEKTPLCATTTGTFTGDGYVVEMLHYQSRPRLYVTANLYRPAQARAGERLPAVLCVCGHSRDSREGVKVQYQSWGIWFARHGYVCMVIDTVQRGEIDSAHRGTYSMNRWWWLSRGYTPGGVETWNGIRGIDYLVSRPDVDPQRIAVTGISGGGAYTFFIAAADERVRVAVPVSGMSDLRCYVTDRGVNGHCDCMFVLNVFQWPWTQIAALVAPRPLLFVNSNDDRLFPMDGNERIANRLERVYTLYGAGDMVDSFVSIGGHAYRKDIRQAVYRFINTHLKNDPAVVTDSEVDVFEKTDDPATFPIPPEKLRVFKTDADLPPDQLNVTIDQHFVPTANVEPPQPGQFTAWKDRLMKELRRVTFASFPSSIPAVKLAEDASFDENGRVHTVRLESEPGISIYARITGDEEKAGASSEALLLLAEQGDKPEWLDRLPADHAYTCWLYPRGTGPGRWTRTNPPNYVERAHFLLGRTVETGQVWDIVALVHTARQDAPDKSAIPIVGHGRWAIIAAYAALWQPAITSITLIDPPLTHMDDNAPAFLNVMRVCDIPDVLGMLAPRPLRIIGAEGPGIEKIKAIYKAADAADKLVIE